MSPTRGAGQSHGQYDLSDHNAGPSAVVRAVRLILKGSFGRRMRLLLLRLLDIASAGVGLDPTDRAMLQYCINSLRFITWQNGEKL